MAAPKKNPRGFQGLYAGGDPAVAKRAVEELRQKVVALVTRDPRKAARVLEAWLRPPGK